MKRRARRFSSKMRYRITTDFIYLMCKLSVIGKKATSTAYNREFDHVHDAMRYILGLETPNNKINYSPIATKDNK